MHPTQCIYGAVLSSIPLWTIRFQVLPKLCSFFGHDFIQIILKYITMILFKFICIVAYELISNLMSLYHNETSLAYINMNSFGPIPGPLSIDHLGRYKIYSSMQWTRIFYICVSQISWCYNNFFRFATVDKFETARLMSSMNLDLISRSSSLKNDELTKYQ